MVENYFSVLIITGKTCSRRDNRGIEHPASSKNNITSHSVVNFKTHCLSSKTNWKTILK